MEPPEKPNEEDCCNTGCIPCILDVYEERLRQYKRRGDSAKPAKKNCISPTAYSVFKLINVDRLTEETRLYTFEYSCPLRKRDVSNSKPNVDEADENQLIYAPGQHFLLRGQLSFNSEQFTRAYTPIPYENPNEKCFTILVKLYEGGLMSQYLRKLQIGSSTVWRGPYGPGDAKMTNDSFVWNLPRKHLFCVAQGTGIAPIYSLIYALLSDDNYQSFVKLFYCCRRDGDVFLRDRLYRLLAHWNFTYEIFLSDCESVNVKYNEIVHERKLGQNDVGNFLYAKIPDHVNVLISGSVSFQKDISDFVESLGYDTFLF